MAIPEARLSTWSNIGAVVSSSETYRQIKAVLESPNASYADQGFEVFLQGSYGNSTNIYSESDVDIVIELKSECIFNIDRLPIKDRLAALQQINCRGNAHDGSITYNGGITYGVDQFKRHVFIQLKTRFGNDVVIGKRAINIKANANRRSADVIVCISYKLFLEYRPYAEPLSGILFKDLSGNPIVNYPKYHATNCIFKNQATGEYFKQTVRIFKNMRCLLIDTRRLNDGDAPSYFLEGMLWNVPETNFGQSYQITVSKCLNWLNACDTNKLLCANQMYYLLHPIAPITWSKERFYKFIGAAINLWNHWQG